MKLKIIFGLVLLSLLVSHDASAFLPLAPGTIIVQQTTTTGKQGTYNQTLANNVVKNLGGQGINLINGSGNPITMVNDPTRNQINITIAASAAGGVTSLNALTGALTIACVSGNTTCTTGISTVTINTAYNIVTTGSSAQTITKQLTLNNLVFGGDSNIGSNGLTNGGHKTTFPTSSGVACQVNQTAPCGGTDGVNSLNFTTSSDFDFNLLPRNMSFIQLNGAVFNFKLKPNIILANESSQTVTKSLTLNSLILGGDANVGSNALTKSGHKSTLPSTTGVLCQTNMTGTCGSGTGTITGSQNAGKATNSVGTLATATSTTILGRNFTGTSPISITKTNDTDARISCSTCVTSVTGTLGNITSSGGTTPIINLGYFAVTTNGVAQNFTAGKKVGFLPTSTTAGILIGTTSANPTSLRQGDIFISGAFMGYNDNTNTTRQLVNLNSAQSLSSKTLADTSTFVASVADSSKKVGFLNSGATTSTTLLLQDNQTTSQHLNWPAIRETETLAVKPQINFTAQANRTGTSSTSGVMLGPGTAITPQVTGRVQIIMDAWATTSGAGDGCRVKIYFGTGADPSNGASVIGTALGSSDIVMISATTGREHMGINTQTTGLTLGTRIWVELMESAVTAGTCTINNVNWSILEL